MSDPKQVTACVVVKDRRDMMAACLDGLAEQTGVDYDVVVIDNGSTDGTYEMLLERAAGFPVPMQVHQVTGPLGRARQAALEATRAPVMASTDSDCIPAPDWLAHLTSQLGESIDVVQGRTLPAVEPDGRWPKTIRVESWSDLYETCNIAYRTDALKAAGGFDPEAEIGGEDTTAGWRLRRRGGRHAFASSALVRHAVTYPGLRWHLDFARGLGMWPAMVREFPEMRDVVLSRRFFLRPRSAAFDLAAAAVLLAATGRPVGLALLIPYARHLRPAWRADRVRGVAEVISYDVSAAIGLLHGSLNNRTVVL